MFVNGELDHYDVCVRFSEVELEGQEECDRLFRRTVLPDMSSYTQSQPLPITGPQLAVQVSNFTEISKIGTIKRDVYSKA